MKQKSFSFLLALLMSMAANVAMAYDVEINGIFYNLSGDEATVTYKDNNYHSYSDRVYIPKSITYNDKTYNVTTIGEYAFFNCHDLIHVTIPESVTSIGDYAFSGCANLYSTAFLTNVTSIGNYAFKECFSLIVDIPSVISIGEGAFYYCTSLKHITIPNSATSIGFRAFQNCTGLTSVTIGNSVTSIGNQAFSGCSGLTSVTIPNSVTSIGDRAFSGCSGLTSVTISNSVTSIGYGAFQFCSGLISVTIGNSVTSIGNCAFESCSSLTSVTIPNSVTSIGDRAFSGCYFASDLFVNNSSLSSDWNWGATLCDEETSDGLLIKENTVTGCRHWVTSVTIPEGVTGIGESAFSGCSGLTSVTIPNSVTSIGNNAFDETSWFNNQPDGLVYAGRVAYKYKGTMSNGTHITIEDGTLGIAGGAFSDCSGLTSITIPESVTGIGIWAFSGCSGLTSVTIPNNVTIIGASAFSGCSGLTSITIPESVTSIGRYAFDGTSWFDNQPDGLVYAGRVAYKYKGTMPNGTQITIKGGTLGIAEYAFSGCSGLTSITIPKSVTNIGSGAYYNCSGLTSVIIPNFVTSIGDYAFYGCSGLTSVTIGNSVTSIGGGAFSGCSGLTSVIIPNSVTSIGSGAFSGCSGLTSVTIGSGVTSIGDGAFYGCYFVSDLFVNNSSLSSASNWGATLCDEETNDGLLIKENTVTGCRQWVTSATIPEGVTSIGESAFEGCSGLTSVTIPNSVTIIGDRAFSGCTGLTSITIPTSVTIIGNRVFQNCSGLTSITIPNSVTSIGEYAFLGCSGLTSVTIGNSVTCIGYGVFYKCSSLTSITIPNSVTIIGDGAFSGCSGLTSVNIPEGVTSIGNGAFSGCSSLTSVIIPNSVTSIGEYAFSGCSGLTSVIIPNNVTSIGNIAFRDCSGLTSVTIGNSVTSIGGGAFSGCSGLISIKVETGNTKYDSRNDCNAIIETASNTLIIGCQSTLIPNSVTSIGMEAFRGCTSLTSITIPDGVTNIDGRSFDGCSSLTSITISSNVTSIGEDAFAGTPWFDNQPNGLVYAGKVAYKYKGIMPINTTIEIHDGTFGIGGGAFRYCSELISVIIPNSVTSIGNGAFSGCSGLRSIKVCKKTPIETSLDLFDSFTYLGATIYVPKGSTAAYAAVYPWSKFRNIAEYDYVDVENQNIVAGNSTTIDIFVHSLGTNLVGFQMDLTLPEGVGIDKTGCSLSSRITDEEQELTIGKLEDGKYRLTSTSLSLTPISGHDGTLLTLKLTAEDGCVGGQATISNILFSTSDSEKIIMDDESFDISILYNLTYMLDGEEYQTLSVVYGTTLTPEPNPTKTGYSFSGWSEIPATMPNHDVMVTGSFTINSYTLTYMLDGEVYKTESVVYGTPLEVEPAPAKEGYTFSGWSRLPETMPAMDVVITGSFTVNSYSLTYIVDDEVYKVLDVDYGTTIVPEPAPQNDGHTFSGWRDLPATMPANDVVVTGIFSYTLTYKVDGEEYKTFSVFYGTELNLEAEPTKDGYTFGGWSEIPETMPANDVVVTGAFYLYGDVNTDEEVDVVDVVDIARYVVATPSARFREKLADLNFDNTVNIADAVTLVNYIAGDQNFVKAWAAPSNFTANDALSLTERNGNLSLSLENEHNYTAFQFDLFVPEDIDVTAMMLNTGRKHGHQLLYNKVEDGHYRVAALSISNNDFKGNEGELLKIALNEVSGNEIFIRGIHFFTAEGHDYIFDDIEGAIATSLNRPTSDPSLYGGEIYDLQGRKRGKLQRGVNIVGGKKVMVK